MKKTLWILNHYAGATHGQSRAFELGQHLVARGHSVTIFAAGRSHYTGMEERVYGRMGWSEEWIRGVRFIWIRTAADRTRRFRNMSSYAARALLAGLRLKERPDVVMGSCPHPLAGLAGWIVARVRGGRSLYEVRDLWPQTGVDQGLLSPRSPVTLLLRGLERFLLSRSDGVVTVLPNLAAYLEAKGIRQQRIWVVPNGVDVDSFDRAVVSGNGRAEGFRVLYAGGFSHYHGLDVVLDAAEILWRRGRSDIEILMVGDGARKAALMAAAAERGLENLKFGPNHPKRELPNLLRTGDVTLFTFRPLSVLNYGISPLKIFDYMAAARPVIFAATAYNDPVAEAGAGFSISPGDPVALADSIEHCADLPRSELDEMGRKGREFVTARHSIAILGRRFEEAVLGEPI